MITFSILAALLIAVALCFVLPTLLRKATSANPDAQRNEANLMVLRDQLRELDADLAAGTLDAPGYRGATLELERRVAEEVPPGMEGSITTSDQRWTATLIGLALPAFAISLYFLLGSPAGLVPIPAVAQQDHAHQITEEQIAGMVAGLAKRLKNTPDDVEGWSMLARSYNALGRFGEAAEAYAHLVKLVPNNADLLTDYADTLAMSLDKRLQGEPEKLIARALESDPKNIKALVLSGSAAFERHDYQAAVIQWQKILKLVPPNSDIARSAISNIAEAQSLSSDPAIAPQATTAAVATEPAVPVTAGTVAGTVELDASLRSKVDGNDTVFIFARALEGPRLPLAVLRKQVKDLPTNFVLDDSMGMVANAKLSDFQNLVVGARISKSGSATASTGDFEGAIQPIRLGANNLKIRINSQR